LWLEIDRTRWKRKIYSVEDLLIEGKMSIQSDSKLSKLQRTSTRLSIKAQRIDFSLGTAFYVKINACKMT